MVNSIFAVLLGALALYAIFAAVRTGARTRVGWVLIAVGAAVQVWNLVTTYSLIVAIVTTLLIVGGFVLARDAVLHPPA